MKNLPAKFQLKSLKILIIGSLQKVRDNVNEEKVRDKVRDNVSHSILVTFFELLQQCLKIFRSSTALKLIFLV